MELHSLLKRQLRRQFGDDGAIPPELLPLIEAVNAAYHEADSDRRMLERSLDLSSRELCLANAEMRAVFNGFPDLFVWLDPTGEIRNIQGGQPSQHLFLFDNETVRLFKGAMRLVHDTGQVVPIEYTNDVGGRSLHFEARLFPLGDGNSLAIIRDITGRKQAEEALAAEKELLAVTLRSIGDAVITTDVSGRIRLMSRVAEAITGVRQSAAVGRPIGHVLVLRDEATGEPIENPAERALRDGGAPPVSVTAKLVARGGASRLVDASAAVIHDGASRAVGVVVVARDITERRRLEEEQLRASKLESVGILAGGIAHDFNNILTSILGGVSLAQLHLTSSPARAAQLLSTAEQASLRARDLTQQLLTFSKGGMPIKETASASDLIRDSAAFALRGSNVSCAFAICDDLSPIEVDPGQMSQVISNLIINADQAMPEGGAIVIGAENVEPGSPTPALGYSDAGYIRIWVSDRGVGIPREHLHKIFDPYFTTKPMGSGLGLATSYSIVKNHGGVIAADSEPGRGTTMSVYLPGSRRVAPRPARRTHPLVGGRGRILVMDDELAVREVVCRMLEFLGYGACAARDGAEAIEIYQREKLEGRAFDALIVDLTVPGGMGGREAIARLRAADPRLVAVASSGYSTDPVMARFADFGFGAILSKPYNIQELDKTLQQLINASRD